MLQVGDFIAVANLAAQVCQALSATSGSKAQFESLLAILNAVGQAMIRAEAACMEFYSSLSNCSDEKDKYLHIDEVADDIVIQRNQCDALLASFLHRYKSYQKSFIGQGSGRLKQGYKSLVFQIHKEDIIKFEKELQGRLQALQLLLNTFYYLSMRHDIADHRMLLQAIDSSTSTATKAIYDVQHKVSESVNKLTIAWKEMPISLGYAWGPEPPIFFIDGLGRKTCLPLILVNNLATFQDILMIMNRDAPGYDRIQKGRYVISNEDAKGALIQHDKWNEVVRPGIHIALSFLLKLPGGRHIQECPRCKSLKTTLSYQENRRRCLRCDLIYGVEAEEQVKLHWKDLKIRPKRPPSTRHPSISSTKPIPKSSITTNNNTHRSRTLPPEEFDHPYSRVLYEQKSISQSTVPQPWNTNHPEFKDFLDNLPPIHSAAASGNVNKLDELCDEGANVNAPWDVTDSVYRHDRTGWDFTGAPPIHLAAYYGQKEAVLFLLSNGADINGRDSAGTTSLHAAAWTGNEDMFRMLLRKNADSSICDYDGWSVTIYAMNQGQDKISRILLEQADGETAALLVKKHTIRYTAKAGSEQIVLAMMKEHEGETHGTPGEHTDILLAEALVGAAEGGHVDLVEELLRFGVDAAARDDCDSTALHWAAWGGHTEIENHRYNNDDNTDDDDDDDDDGSAFARRTVTSPSHEEVIRRSLRHGSPDLINVQNSQGCTPLHWVAGAGSVGMIRFLLRNGADPNIRDTDKRSPLDRAVATSDKTVLQEFRDHTED